MKKLEEKFRLLGDPAFVGLIVGIFLGLLTRQAPTTIFGIGMGIASVLILIPRMVSIMMEGLTPIGNAASAYMKKHMGEDAELFIGMDVALGLGDPACITCTALCIPITILFAFIIPNMVYFPIGLLGIVCYTTVMCVLASEREPVEEPDLFHRIHVSDHILCQYVCAGVYKDAFSDGPENTGNGSGRIFWI